MGLVLAYLYEALGWTPKHHMGMKAGACSAGTQDRNKKIRSSRLSLAVL